MACSGPCASKSHGFIGLRSASHLLCPLRLPPAAAFHCANLRCVLDGIFPPERPRVRLLRRYPGRILAGFSPCQLHALQILPPGPPPFVRAVAFGLYQGRMKAAIHALKYDGLHPAARGLGRMLAEAIAQLADDAPAEMLVVPVPLHRSKYCPAGLQSGPVPGRPRARIFCASPILIGG